MNFFQVILMLMPYCSCSTLVDITSELFGGRFGDLIAAYGDFDANKQTDIFVISNHGRSVGIYLQSEEGTFHYKDLLTVNKTNGLLITSVMPGDFDNDVQMDVLVTLIHNEADGDNRPVSLRVYWGTGKGVHGQPYEEFEQFQDQPLILDWNADMVPDVLGETEAGKRVVYLASGTKERKFKYTSWKNGTAPFRIPHSNAFLDLNEDYMADLSITIDKDGSTQFEKWYSENGRFIKKHDITLEELKNPAIVGQSSFLDFDQSGKVSMLLPVCGDESCEDSAIWLYNHNEDKEKHQWENLEVSFKNGDKKYHFIPPDKNLAKQHMNQYMPITLHIGDFNMDGFPDVLTVMSRKDGDKDIQEAVLLFSEECSSCDKTGKRKLAPQWNTKLQSLSGVVLATFFDIGENGILDILTVSMTNDDGGQKVPAMKAYRNDLDADTCFVKITVVSGFCNSECPEDRNPYGVNQPGPTITYKTQYTIGKYKQSTASQLSQSAHFAAQLPYTIFGLGQTPNFVDQVSVGIPTPAGEKEARKHQWTQIIPNSQLIVIPFPNHKPSDWTLKLYVTPSKLIYITGFSLLGTCAVCGIIVGILHLLERQEDKVEKQQESQKFHFDAM